LEHRQVEKPLERFLYLVGFSVLLVDGCAGLALLISFFLSFQQLYSLDGPVFHYRKPIGMSIDAHDSFSSTKTYST
jgi:hypothetical protein